MGDASPQTRRWLSSGPCYVDCTDSPALLSGFVSFSQWWRAAGTRRQYNAPSGATLLVACLALRICLPSSLSPSLVLGAALRTPHHHHMTRAFSATVSAAPPAPHLPCHFTPLFSGFRRVDWRFPPPPLGKVCGSIGRIYQAGEQIVWKAARNVEVCGDLITPDLGFLEGLAVETLLARLKQSYVVPSRIFWALKRYVLVSRPEVAHRSV